MRSRNFWSRLWSSFSSDESFSNGLKHLETLFAKALSVAMIVVIIVAIVDLGRFLLQELSSEPYGFFSTTLIEIFGLFLNVLIAMEVLENITAYLKKHVVQVELVIVTSLIAVARKIIIFDSKQATGLELIGLGVAILSLAISYWIVRRANRDQN
ncbi:phosphate-starvation-inducible PsiE family protein [Leptolyngbya sp. AN02str]|uniref:phosphate-starvation-inducible PsiE family protein n=1 Tax=Leptolyngbya sp. AN02str TaxID=3423363 RepID=UPI003D31D44D